MNKVVPAAMAVAALGMAVVTALPAHAANPRITISNGSRTCITAWDHIDQNGRPYGARQVRCSGETFSTNVDWDMVCWPNGYYLVYTFGSSGAKTDKTSDNCHKFNDGVVVSIFTKKK